MRRTYLVTYDICDPKRLRLVFKKMHGFGQPLQFSVFLCSLSAVERLIMIAELKALIDSTVDRVLIAKLEQTETAEPNLEYIGQPLTTKTDGPFIF